MQPFICKYADPVIHPRVLKCVHQGKVRDTFELPEFPNHLLVVSTDRISTHNIVHQSLIPSKGEVLTALTVYWMAKWVYYFNNHLVAWGQKIFDYLPPGDYPEFLARRAIVVEKLNMVPVEFIYRNRMAGSLWKTYNKGLPNPYSVELSPGLKLMSSFPDPIFTPTEKSETDAPLDARQVTNAYPAACDLVAWVYKMAGKYALERGVEIIDGKFEVGVGTKGGSYILADEILTPDSCRFVEASSIEVGKDPKWLDKEYVRAEAERIWAGGKKYPLEFSDEVINETTCRYLDIFKTLTGLHLDDFQREYL